MRRLKHQRINKSRRSDSLAGVSSFKTRNYLQSYYVYVGDKSPSIFLAKSSGITTFTKLTFIHAFKNLPYVHHCKLATIHHDYQNGGSVVKTKPQ